MFRTISIIFWLIIGVFSSLSFASSLEHASASKVGDDESHRKLELGVKGRVVIIAIVTLILLAVIAVSRIPVATVITGLALSICTILFSLMLRSNGIHTLLSSFLFWAGEFCGSLTFANYRTDNKALGSIYIILQLVCLVLILIVGCLPNLIAKVKERIEENRAAEELEDEKARALIDDDDEEDSDREYDRKLKKQFYDRLICVITIILIIIVLLAIIWLQNKYGIFPPYSN